MIQLCWTGDWTQLEGTAVLDRRLDTAGGATYRYDRAPYLVAVLRFQSRAVTWGQNVRLLAHCMVSPSCWVT
jgi:hypothetical protein